MSQSFGLSVSQSVSQSVGKSVSQSVSQSPSPVAVVVIIHGRVATARDLHVLLHSTVGNLAPVVAPPIRPGGVNGRAAEMPSDWGSRQRMPALVDGRLLLIFIPNNRPIGPLDDRRKHRHVLVLIISGKVT